MCFPEDGILKPKHAVDEFVNKWCIDMYLHAVLVQYWILLRTESCWTTECCGEHECQTGGWRKLRN